MGGRTGTAPVPMKLILIDSHTALIPSMRSYNPGHEHGVHPLDPVYAVALLEPGLLKIDAAARSISCFNAGFEKKTCQEMSAATAPPAMPSTPGKAASTAAAGR